MRVSWKHVLLTVLACAMAPTAGRAQMGSIGSYSRPKTNQNPTFSPYLNLNRGGNPAINYFGTVKPQIEMNRSFQQIEQGTFGMDPRFPVGGTGGVGPDGNPIAGGRQYYPDPTTGLQTGHPATFMYYSHYYRFPGTPGGGGGGGAGGSSGVGGNNTFGRPGQGMPFFMGTGNGLILPVNPSGANPIGGNLSNPSPVAP